MSKREVIKQVPSLEAVQKFLADYSGDGWSIIQAEGLISHYGFPASWVRPITHTHRSTSDHKGNIYDNSGKRVEAMRGVHTLVILDRLASMLNLECPSYLGRGRQAQSYSAALAKYIQEHKR